MSWQLQLSSVGQGTLLQLPKSQCPQQLLPVASCSLAGCQPKLLLENWSNSLWQSVYPSDVIPPEWRWATVCLAGCGLVTSKLPVHNCWSRIRTVSMSSIPRMLQQLLCPFSLAENTLGSACPPAAAVSVLAWPEPRCTASGLSIRCQGNCTCGLLAGDDLCK
jgi:hypothetical protein